MTPMEMRAEMERLRQRYFEIVKVARRAFEAMNAPNDLDRWIEAKSDLANFLDIVSQEER
jgi:hypothetical protein